MLWSTSNSYRFSSDASTVNIKFPSWANSTLPSAGVTDTNVGAVLSGAASKAVTPVAFITTSSKSLFL